MEELGALWLRESKAGRKYMSGTVAGERVVVFKNTFKKPGESSPDYRVYKSEPREEQSSPERERERSAPVPEDFDDEIPF